MCVPIIITGLSHWNECGCVYLHINSCSRLTLTARTQTTCINRLAWDEMIRARIELISAVIGRCLITLTARKWHSRPWGIGVHAHPRVLQTLTSQCSAGHSGPGDRVDATLARHPPKHRYRAVAVTTDGKDSPQQQQPKEPTVFTQPPIWAHDHRAEVQSRYPEESTLTPLHSLCLSSSWVIAHRHRSWGYLWPHPLTFNAVAVNHVICPLLRNPKAPSWYTSQTHCELCASSLVWFDLLRVYNFLKRSGVSDHL